VRVIVRDARCERERESATSSEQEEAGETRGMTWD
jgi:hypothetical protein